MRINTPFDSIKLDVALLFASRFPTIACRLVLIICLISPSSTCPESQQTSRTCLNLSLITFLNQSSQVVIPQAPEGTAQLDFVLKAYRAVSFSQSTFNTPMDCGGILKLTGTSTRGIRTSNHAWHTLGGPLLILIAHSDSSEDVVVFMGGPTSPETCLRSSLAAVHCPLLSR